MWYFLLVLIFGALTFLSNSIIIHWSKFKAFADDKINVTENREFGLESLENIVGKGENAGNQDFAPFPTMFSKGLSYRVVKSRDHVEKG